MPGLIRDFQRVDARRGGRRYEPRAHRMAREVTGKADGRAPARDYPGHAPAAQPSGGLRVPVQGDEQGEWAKTRG